MKLLKYIPLQLVLFLIIGILIGFYISFTPSFISGVLLIVLCILGSVYLINREKIVQNNYFALFAFISFICIGIATSTFNNDLLKKNHYSSYLSNSSVTSVLLVDKVLKPNSYYNRYFAKVVLVNSDKTHGKILLNIAKDSINTILNVDDKFIVAAKFNTINEPLNPYQFNYKRYLEKQQVYYQITLKNKEYVLLKGDGHSIKGWAFLFRKKINTALIKNGYEGDVLAIINALLLGQRQEISKDIMQNYQNAGAIHILAVSGLHVGIILLLLNFLLKPIEKIKYGIHIKLLIVIVLLWVFAFVAGLSASVVRAVTMFTAVAIALSLKRSKNVYNALIISIFFLLLFNPNYIFDVGFQLSYLAVFFIVWTQPILYKLWKPKLKIVDYFWQLLTVSVAAQVGVLPLSLYYFHQFPGLFFLANLLIIPFLGIILGVGILVIALALMNILPEIIAEFYKKVIELLNSIVEWIGHQESFLFQNISFTMASVVLYFFLIILFFKWIEIKNRIYLKLTLITIVIFQLNLIKEKYVSHSDDEFIIFNKTRHSIVGIKKKAILRLHHSLDAKTLKNDVVIRSYLTGSNATINSLIDQPKNIYDLNGKKMLVIDSLGIYAIPNFSPDYILLKESPNINLDRVIKSLNPKEIIADASNYKNHVKIWQKTCKNNNIKFHYIVKHGAFREKL